MTLDEFCKDLANGDWRSIVVRKLVGELIQNESKEKIVASWCNEGDTLLLYYIVTNKRFFEICVDSDSFGYKSHFLRHLSSLREKIVPDCSDSYGFKKSAYFSDEDSFAAVSCYRVELSFSAAKEKSEEATFSLSAPFFPSKPNREHLHFERLRDFVRNFHNAVTGL